MPAKKLFGFLNRPAKNAAPAAVSPRHRTLAPADWTPGCPLLALEWLPFPPWKSTSIERQWHCAGGRLLLQEKRRGTPAHRLLFPLDENHKPEPLESGDWLLSNGGDTLFLIDSHNPSMMVLAEHDATTLEFRRSLGVTLPEAKGLELLHHSFTPERVLWVFIREAKGQRRVWWNRIELGDWRAIGWTEFAPPFEDTTIVAVTSDRMVLCMEAQATQPAYASCDLRRESCAPMDHLPVPFEMPQPISEPPGGYEIRLARIGSDHQSPDFLAPPEAALFMERGYPSGSDGAITDAAKKPIWYGAVIFQRHAKPDSTRVLSGDLAASLAWTAPPTGMWSGRYLSIFPLGTTHLLVVQGLLDAAGDPLIRFGWLSLKNPRLDWWGYCPWPANEPPLEDTNPPWELFATPTGYLLAGTGAYAALPLPDDIPLPTVFGQIQTG